MYKPLALAIVAGLLFTVGCKKKTEEEVALARIPVVAPDTARTPDAILEHFQYAMVRKDPKHLETFFPEDKGMALGGTNRFHRDAGLMRLLLTAEEIEALGVQGLLEKGYISDSWTSGDYTRIIAELDSGRRTDIEPGMERINPSRLDMPIVQGLDEKTAERLQKDLIEALEVNLKGAYAAGLYRLLKAIPVEGWSYVTATAHPNAQGDKAKNDIVFKINETDIAVSVVGRNADESMYIWVIEFKQGPRAIQRLLGINPEAVNAEQGA